MQNLNYGRDEMISALEKWGYTVKKENREFSRSVYHNDVEYYEIDVFVVYDSAGKEMIERYGFYRGARSMVEDVFWSQLQKRLLNLTFSS